MIIYFSRSRKRQSFAAFTLVELMVSVSILVILMLVVSNFIGLVQRTWVRTNSNASQFREARHAFDSLTKTLAQATLNSYWKSDTTVSGSAGLGEVILSGTRFKRESELQFVCGPTVGGTGALFPSGSNSQYPGHGVFFQAPLGVTSLVETSGNTSQADTQDLVNLLCGRGYYVEWGPDTAFRPKFLESKGVPVRTRFRLMEFSPTSEKNRIYDQALRPIVNNSKQWFLQPVGGGGDARSMTVSNAAETAATRAFTRPVAENILLLIISPQTHTIGKGNTAQATLNATSIAPSYSYDSLLTSNSTSTNPQGTQHLLPPLLKVSMVALDARSGEMLSDEQNGIYKDVTQALAGIFKSAASYEQDLNTTLIPLLIKKRLAYRVFTTTIALKQSRWSK